MGTPALVALVGFAVGSVPNAWLLVRLVTRGDVSRDGSGNVGALNAMRVARARWVGVVVLLLDALKGALAVLLGGLLAEGLPVQSATACAAALGAIAAHNYNPWLSIARRRLVGGKGFAAAAGAAAVAWPWMLIVWLGTCLVVWVVLRLARGVTDEAPASAVATLAIVPGGFALYGVAVAVFGVGLFLLVAPKLLPESLAVLKRSA